MGEIQDRIDSGSIPVLWKDEPIVQTETGYYQVCTRTLEVVKISGVCESVHFPGMIDLTEAICFPWQERDEAQRKYRAMVKNN